MTNKRSKHLKRVIMLNPQGYMQYPPPLGSTDTGGQTLYVLQLARALAKKNIKVDILTRQFDNQPEIEQVAENVKIIRIPCGPNTFVQKEKMYELMPEMVDGIMKHIQKTRKVYDIIHSHYWDGGYAGNLLARKLKIPHIYTPHSLGKLKRLEMAAVEEVPLKKLKPMYRYHVRNAIEQQIIDKANAVVVLCETSRIQILQYYIAEFEKLHVIYPGVELKYFHARKNSIDKKIKLKKNSILAICRLVPAKGVDRIIDALSLLKNKVDFHLYVSGDLNLANRSKEEIESEKRIKELIKKYRLQKHVSFIGFVSHEHELPAYYRASSIFVLASRYEPFGLTTLEAMATGTPAIVSSVAGSREIIVDGLNGCIVDTHDRVLLAKSIKKLLTNKRMHKKMSENAAFTVKEHYSWDNIVNNYIKLYKGLL